MRDTALTRRRSNNTHHVTWHVSYGDVHVGTIGERAGVPVGVDQLHWSAAFIPACILDTTAPGRRPECRPRRGSRRRPSSWDITYLRLEAKSGARRPSLKFSRLRTSPSGQHRKRVAAPG
jgi:hypothetical protein